MAKIPCSPDNPHDDEPAGDWVPNGTGSCRPLRCKKCGMAAQENRAEPVEASHPLINQQ